MKRILKSEEVVVLEGKVLTKEELENVASEVGFSLVEIEMDEANNKIEISNQQDFLDFHKHVENRVLFFTYDYDDKYDFLIPEEPFLNKEYAEPIQEQIDAKINEYNKMIEETDFDQPSGLMMCYIQDGFLFYNYTFNDLYDFPGYEDIVEEVIQGLPSKKLEEFKKNHQENIQKEVQKLKESIFSDPNFKVATNQLKRKQYLFDLLQNNSENEKLIKDAGYLYPFVFIEEIWREFKEKGLHKS